MISKREQRLAETVSVQLAKALERRNLRPAITAVYLTEINGMTLHISVLDTHRIGDHTRYTSAQLLHQLRTDLRGMPVYLSNTNGIRYVTLLSRLPRLPKHVALPVDAPVDMVQIGVRLSGEPVAARWDSLRHIAVLGISGSGKSVFLRLLAHQAVRAGMRLALADMDGATFPSLDGHQSLVMPIAETPSATLELIQHTLRECDLRAHLYRSLRKPAENLAEYNLLAVRTGKEPLPRWLVVLDEASAALSALGGGRSELGQTLAQLGWRGRKFGIHFVFAAQEFGKELLGAVREQAGLAVCFRVRSEDMARRMGCAGASRIPEGRPGLAVTDRWGLVQTYFVDKDQRLEMRLAEEERLLFEKAESGGGLLTRERVMEWAGLSEWQARKRLEGWALRGWVEKDVRRNNAYQLTDKARRLLSNTPTAPTAPTENNTEQEATITHD
ncbi:MAG: DUF87 domain-containing protein [Anaerolineae bacterium]|nr:DUF87 domain-containing protein [Anaerolineae bacterium]